ncbi:MAG: hypothetical protein JW959_03640 [Pirellulales bacterium]|nr:hypothetical protein [Pirellulales bacterium]
MQLSLAHGHSPMTMLAVAAAALLLAALCYRRTFKSLGLRRWGALYLLRAAAILLVVVLLFQPVLSYQKERAEKPALICLLDASASMEMADDASGISRFDRVREKYIEWSEKLRNDFRLLPVAFADRALRLENLDQLNAMIPNGRATSLRRALDAASNQLAPAEIAAVLMLSDGINNAAGDPVEKAAELGLTVHCIGVGAGMRSNRDYRDVRATGIDCPDRMMLGNAARVAGSIDAAGMNNRVIEVFLDEDGRQVAGAELTLDDVEGSQQVVFEFTPETKGRHTFTVRVPPVAGERISQNNSRSAVAAVHEAEIGVLYVEGTLRAEYGALVDRFLAKDPDLEFCALVQTRPNVFLQRTNMSELRLAAIPADRKTIERFNVFIIGDLDASYLRPEQQEMILDRVRAGAGLVMLGGYHSLGPGGYADAPLAKALPVELGNREIGQYTEPFLPVLTPEGARHPIFANIAQFFPSRGGGPTAPGLTPLAGCTKVGRAKAAASVLATLADGPSSMPVLAVQPLDRGRTAVFAGDTTRNWQQVSRSLGRESPFLRFWGQMVRWLAGRSEEVSNTAGVVADTDKAQYDPDQPVIISAVVRDRQGQATGNARVSADLKDAAGRSERIELAPVPGPGGHYRGTFTPPAPGRYEVRVAAELDGLSLSAATVPIEVGSLNLEYEKLDPDEKTLMDVAAASGGRYVHLSTADHFVERLQREQRKKTVYVERRLYWPPGAWTLLVAALTAEWILRRRNQLR